MRYRRFNLDALMDVAITAAGRDAKSCEMNQVMVEMDEKFFATDFQ